MHSSSCPRTDGARADGSRTLAEVVRLFGSDYRRTYSPSGLQRGVLQQIQDCRSETLGGRRERCQACGFERVLYNSCRNRHCPACQHLARARWLEDRKRDLLPVPYFHGVFTLPDILTPLARVNKKTAADILFSSVSATLQAFAADPRHGLEGRLGYLAVLHTWNQLLLEHYHLHCVIPAGALSVDGTQWHPCPNEEFLFPVEALSPLFRHTLSVVEELPPLRQRVPAHCRSP